MIWRCIISTKKYDEHHKLPWAGCTCKRARREKDRKFCTCFYSDKENAITVEKELHRLWHILFPGSFTFPKVAADLSLYFNYLHRSSAPIIFRVGGISTVIPDEVILDGICHEITSAKAHVRIEKMSRRLDVFMTLSHMKKMDYLLNDIAHIWLPPYLFIAAYREREESYTYERIG